MKDLVSIITVNWNGGKTLEKAVQKMLDADGEKEVIVVDNASSDESIKPIKEKFSKVILIENQKNEGFAKANNQAIKKARGNFIILVNPDTEINKDCFSKTINYFKTHPDVGIIGAALINTDGSTQRSGRKYPSIIRELLYYSNLWSIQPVFFQSFFDFDHQNNDTEREVDEVSGAYMAIKKEVINKIGTLDEKFYMYYEDTDFCLRAKNAGFKTMFVPSIKLKHFHAKSAAIKPKRVNAWMTRSALIYADKWFSDLSYSFLQSILSFRAIFELSKLQINNLLNRGDSEDRREAIKVWNQILKGNI